MEDTGRKTRQTVFFCFFKLFLKPGLALLSAKLAFCLLGEREDGLLALFHGFGGGIGGEEVVGRLLADVGEDVGDTTDAL